MKKNIKHCAACVIFSNRTRIDPEMGTSEHLESLEQAKKCLILWGSSFGIAAKTVSNNSVSKCSTLVMFQKVFAHVGRLSVLYIISSVLVGALSF